MTHEEQVARVSRLFRGGDKAKKANAIRRNLEQVREALTRTETFGKRRDAADHLDKIANYADKLASELQIANLQPFLENDAWAFAGVRLSKLQAELQGMSEISKHRAKLVRGPGNFTLADDLGFPKATQVVAVFVILLWERLHGRKPDDQNQDAVDACEALFSLATARDGGCIPEVGTGNGRWERHIHDGRSGLNKARNPEELAKARFGEDSVNSRFVISYWHALTATTEMLDELGILASPVESIGPDVIRT